jgi:hypothetical protein
MHEESNLPEEVRILDRRRFLVRAGGLCIVTPLLLPDEAAAAPNHKIDVTINGFAAAEEKKVRSAFWLAMERCFKQKVIKLTSKNTRRSRGPAINKEKPDVDVACTSKEAEEFITVYTVYGLKTMMNIDNKDNFDFAIAIAAADLQGNAVGRAPLALDTVWGYHIRQEKKRPKYAIELDRKAVKDRSADGTAGTIWHEMLHNAGLSHGSGTDYEKAYAGHVIKEWGLAVQVDGVDGFNLTNDPYARKGCG